MKRTLLTILLVFSLTTAAFAQFAGNGPFGRLPFKFGPFGRHPFSNNPGGGGSCSTPGQVVDDSGNCVVDDSGNPVITG